MNFVEIEKLRSELASFLPRIIGLPKVLVLFSFYEKLLTSNDANLINAFAVEFIDEYLTELGSYSPYYSEPKRTEQLLKQLTELKLAPVLGNYSGRIEELILSITKKLDNLFALLDGNTAQTEKRNKLLFPLLGKVVTSSETHTYASIEPITIKVTTAKHKDFFVFVPSHQKKEQLEEQTKISFQLALQYLKNYKHKFHKYHEALIYFENISAEYDGYSLGIALTIGFIEQLSVLYNLPYLTIVKNNVASTGGLDNNGYISPLGEEIIKLKVKAAFYSDIETLIISEADEITAKQELRELNEKYPKRVLRLAHVESLTDLLNRRNLVEIKKQSPILRTAKNIKKNWIVTTLSIIIILIIGFIWIRDFDDNPAMIYNEPNRLYIKNKSGRILWSKQRSYTYSKFLGILGTTTTQKLVDIDGDGYNEILLTSEPDEILSSPKDFGRIICLDRKGNEIWKYIFADTVTSEREFLPPPYGSNIIDTVTIDGEKELIVFANSRNSFSSAIYCLDLKTGKRINGTLWNSGHIIRGFIDDRFTAGKKSIVFSCWNNGYEMCGTVTIGLDQLLNKMVLPTTPNYLIKNFPVAKTLAYILLPNSDYNKYLQRRHASLWDQGLRIGENDDFIVQLFQNYDREYIVFEIKYNMKNVDVVIDDQFRVARDSLVVHGILKYPLTDTPEYKNLLKSQILYWDGKKFARREDLN